MMGIEAVRRLDFCRRVDSNLLMPDSQNLQKSRNISRQIVGFSLSQDMAREVKAHAGKQGLSLRKLFEDMWRVYTSQDSGQKR
jgi:hypothetical protein